MDKSVLPSQITSSTRLSFIEKTLNMNEKLLLSKLNSNTSSDQNDMLEFLYNNNSTVHSSNQRIIQGNHLTIKESYSYRNIFDKGLDNYIMQVNLFPFIEIESNDKNNYSHPSLKNEDKHKDKDKENKIIFSKSTKIKSHRTIKIDKYLERKRVYNKASKHHKGLSCFDCFGQRINFNQQQLSPLNCKDNTSLQIFIEKNLMKNNQNDANSVIPNQLRNTDNILLPKNVATDLSTMHMNNYSGNFNMNDILNLKNNSLNISNKSGQTFNLFSVSNKAITFILTNDIVKGISIISKSSNEEYIIHSYTYLFDKNAFVNDLYFYELKLRTNIEKVLQSKKIKYPLVLYGNVFLPQVVFFRGDEEVNFNLLDYPIVSSMIIAQLIPDNFSTKTEDILSINNKIIEEAITLSDDLDYGTILVNLLPIAEINQIFSVIKNYIDILNNNKSLNNYSVNLLLNMTANQFQSYTNTSGVPQLLEKSNITTTIITL